MAVCAFCLFALAYQAPFRLTLHIGGDVELRRRLDDAPFLRSRNGTEPQGHGVQPADLVPDPDCPGAEILWYDYVARTGERPYRWTTNDSELRVPGVGGGAWLVEVVAGRGGRPGDTPLPSSWQIGDDYAFTVELPPGEPRRFRLLVPATAAGDARVSFYTAPFTPPGDPRVLGFVLHEARVTSVGGGPRAPAWPQVGLLTLALAGVYVAARALDAGRRESLALGAGLALAGAAALALARPAVTLFTPTLAGLAIGGALLGLAVRALTARLQARDPARAAFARRVIALAALGLALRLGGMWHPHAIYSDSGFHANKLFALALGQVLQSAGLPAESGGGEAPYPTGPYLLLAPGLLLLPDGHAARVALMQAGAALLDSLLIPLIALLAVRAGLGRAAALLGAACYLLPITAMESFAVGELANIAGQAMAMPFVALLALGWLAQGDKGTRRGGDGRFFVALGALCAGLLAHSGVTLSLGALAAAAWGLGLLGRLRGRRGPAGPVRLALVGATALALTGLFYYSAPLYLDTLLGRLGGEPPAVAVAAAPAAEECDQPVAAARPGLTPLSIVGETALTALGLQAPRSRYWPLPAALCLTALGGLWLLWRERKPGAAGLRLALGAWWLGALLTQGLLLVADQALRWTMFLYPALCLSAAALLGWLWARGRAGRLGTALILLATLGYGLYMWIVQVRDYFHV